MLRLVECKIVLYPRPDAQGLREVIQHRQPTWGVGTRRITQTQRTREKFLSLAVRHSNVEVRLKNNGANSAGQAEQPRMNDSRDEEDQAAQGNISAHLPRTHSRSPANNK